MNYQEEPLLGEMSTSKMTSMDPAEPRSQAFEDSPAYLVLRNLLEKKFRKVDSSQLDLIYGTSTRIGNLFTLALCGLLSQQFEVPDGHVRLADDGEGHYLIYGPGVHCVRNMFLNLHRRSIPLTQNLIQHGNRTIVTVPQGQIGYAQDMGQPVILPPGLHEWCSDTMIFVESVDVNNSVILLGPYTVLTVDEGYAAIAQNNGQQVILEGGKTHLLGHRNFKFEKFMTEKIQTDDLQRIEATSADNVLLHTDATVVWKISSVLTAARMAADTMRPDGSDSQSAQSDIKKLRNDVLKQATASLAAFIGEIRYSDSFHISAANKNKSSAVTGIPVAQAAQDGDVPSSSPIFDSERMATAVETANEVTNAYGVTIVSINIISATPADADLRVALAKGAVAAAEAEQAEVAATGTAKAQRILAQGDADAETIRAQGSKAAADLLESSDVAVELAKLERTGELLGNKTTFFMGADAKSLSSLLSNPNVVSSQ
ncbi:hypothetical protein CYMTET_22512 [Cymbomonas tetramitiformis]|uniref:Band 7 domain-containing protein n=1 Tax=Cymbomonas tetramitiformis TaxID=36881 RepID=A0AAE0G032_9CHLO|nr:hypothetical protein CYMTET_22512 [Cymbomonas tetramitiformis]